MRRSLACLALLVALLADAAPALAACREVWVRDGGAGGQVRKQTVCDDDDTRDRRHLERRVRELERRERWRTHRDARERYDTEPPVIVIPPSDPD
jgi:hypothetical protein